MFAANSVKTAANLPKQTAVAAPCAKKSVTASETAKKLMTAAAAQSAATNLVNAAKPPAKKAATAN
jgi:hypothetical protein